MPTRNRHRENGRHATAHALERRMLFAFGLTTTSSLYTVDTGAQLVFSVQRTASSGAVGDLTSMKLSGTDLEAPYATSSRYSHYESGLSSSTAVTATVDPNGQWILISCDDTSGVGVIQYYLARKGYNNIYMATYSAGPASPSPGEMRFITYTNPTVLTNIPAPSNNAGSTGAIESSDVFGHPDGTTTSKYYGEYRAIDTQTYGDTGTGFGIFMNIGNRETSSGGPFFKDIDFQNNELYTYVFSGHSQTEAFRPGLKGFYALELTTGANPGAPDYSWIDTSGAGASVTGYVGSSGRGTLTGTASGTPSTLQTTVALSNAADQYWATPNATTGVYTVTGVLPGTYTETIYQGELAVGTRSVTITAGQTTTANIVSTLYTPAAASTIFRIGTWDGTPLGFLNADKITYMHPTDTRMSAWAADSTGVTNFTVGTDADSSFPMAEWHTQTAAAPYLDTDNRITFNLTTAQAGIAYTLRIGTTRSMQGRPTASINSGTYSTSVPTQATQPDSRGLTTGNWRGNNFTYSFNIPASALKAGTNTIDIYCTSGSTGTIYSGYQIYDAIDLVTTTSLTSAPYVKTVTVTPSTASILIGGSQAFTVTAYDQTGKVIAANFGWSVASGIVNQVGEYTAPGTAGSDTVTATSVVFTNGTVTSPAVAGTAAVTIVGTTFAASAGDGFYLRLAADGTTEQLWLGTPGAVGPSYAANPTYSAPLAGLPSFTFGAGSSANGALTVDASNGNPVPSGGVSYDGGAGTDTLSLVGSSGANAVTINGTQVLLGSSIITYANTEAIRLTLGAGADTVTQTAQPASTVTWTDPTAADALAVTVGTFTFAAPAAGAGFVPMALGSVTVGSGAKVSLATAASPADRTVLALSSNPSIAGAVGAWKGTIDLGGNDLLVTGGVLATITDELRSGANMAAGGNWNGTGITSSAAAANSANLTALGSMQNTGSVTKLDGTTTVSGDVLVKYTYYGDTNLDGVVNVADYTRIDAGYIANGTLTGWNNGDFNYDRTIDGSDYTLIDNAFNMTTKSATAAAVQATPVAAVVAVPAARVAPRASSATGAVIAAMQQTSDDERRRRHLSRG